MQRLTRPRLVAAAVLLGSAGLAEAQETCQTGIDAVEDRLDAEAVSDNLAQSIRDLLNLADGTDDCVGFVAAVENTLDAAMNRSRTGQAETGRRIRAADVPAEPDAPEAELDIAIPEPEIQITAENEHPEFDDTTVVLNDLSETDGTADRSGAAMTEQQARELVGETLETRSGEDIGEIDELIRSADGRLYFTVETGGFLGIGEDERAVPIEAIERNADGEPVLSMSRQELEALPLFEEGQYQEVELLD